MYDMDNMYDIFKYIIYLIKYLYLIKYYNKIFIGYYLSVVVSWQRRSLR